MREEENRPRPASRQVIAGAVTGPPRTGGNLIDTYPWHLALDEADHLVSLRAIQR